MSQQTMSTSTGGRERILREALNKFIESGFAAVSMQQIADSAGVTKATLYHHFRDKEDLFLEVMRSGVTRSQDNLEKAVDAGTTLRDKVVSVAMYLFGSERTDLHRLFGDLHQHVGTERQTAFWQSFQRPWVYLEEPIRHAIASGEIVAVDPEITARVYFSAIAGQLQIARYHADIPYPDAALAEQVVDLLLDGITPCRLSK